MFRRFVLFALLLMILPISAQEVNPREVVLQAIQGLSEGYQFTMTTVTFQTFTNVDCEVINANTRLTAEGVVLGDEQVKFGVTGGEAVTDFDAMPLIFFDRVMVDDTLYVNFPPLMAMSYGITPGWWVYDDLIDSIEGEGMRVSIDSVVNSPIPHTLNLDKRLVFVEEVERETLDGVEMRVFNIRLSTVPTQVMPFTEQITYLLDNARQMLASDNVASIGLWIGAEDGLLYKGLGESYLFIPLTELYNAARYDQEIITQMAFTITNHGESVDITTPEVTND